MMQEKSELHRNFSKWLSFIHTKHPIARIDCEKESEDKLRVLHLDSEVENSSVENNSFQNAIEHVVSAVKFLSQNLRHNVDKVANVQNGIFLVRFAYVEDRDLILKYDRPFFDHKPVIMKPLSENVDCTKDCFQEDIRLARITEEKSPMILLGIWDFKNEDLSEILDKDGDLDDNERKKVGVKKQDAVKSGLAANPSGLIYLLETKGKDSDSLESYVHDCQHPANDCSINALCYDSKEWARICCELLGNGGWKEMYEGLWDEMANEAWCNSYENDVGKFLPEDVSDHSPMVRGTGAVPRHFLCLAGLATRLNTQDRLKQMRIVTDDSCIFFASHVETAEHLFFKCSASTSCVKEITDWVGMTG
ncbi:D-amino acid dehydrogenase 2 [Bienertia sinuspersici]